MRTSKMERQLGNVLGGEGERQLAVMVAFSRLSIGRKMIIVREQLSR